jgi:hypothetical protein
MKRRITAGVAAVAALFGAGVAGAPPAHAEELTCRGTIGARTVDNLRVPQGATCTLNGTRVKGTIKVQRNATLQAVRIRVVGNVQGEGAAIVRVLQGSTVGGSVQVVQGGLSRVADSVVTGDILNDENRRAVSAVRNRVGGNIQAFKNTGGVTFSANRVDGNLQCKENQPRPTGSANVVRGNKEDQCSRL